MTAAGDRPSSRKPKGPGKTGQPGPKKPVVARPDGDLNAPSLRTPDTLKLPCYLLLMKLTERGAAHVDGIPDRYKELEQLTLDHGGHVAFYLVTMGPYDIAAAVFVPDDESAMTLAMRLTEQGYVTTLTMKAFDIVPWFGPFGNKPK